MMENEHANGNSRLDSITFRTQSATSRVVGEGYFGPCNYGEPMVDFPAWSEMTTKQVQACVLACRDALSGKGPRVCIAATHTRTVYPLPMFEALARMIEGQK